MNKIEYFKKYTLPYKLYNKISWVISLFAITENDTNDKPYIGKIIYELGFAKFYDETMSLQTLDGVTKNTPAFSFKELITIEEPSSKKIINTTIGNYLANLICIINPFNGKVAYINKTFDVSEIEDMIAPLLEDNPKPGQPLRDDVIYIKEYKDFVMSLNYMSGLTQVVVPAYTEKSLMSAPGIKEYKAKLLEENKDKLDDPVVISQIEEKLQAFDKEFLKGDDGMRFKPIVRKRLYQMYGAEKGIGDSTNRKLSRNSLDEGWEINSLPDYINALRAGSFNRGSETQLGGELVKWLLRASSNISVDMTDCGSKLGYKLLVDEKNYNEIIGLNIISGSNVLAIKSKDDAKKYIGKEVSYRTPLYCKNPGINYCKTCLGERLTVNERGISIAVADLGSTIMLSFMGAMHGKDLVTTELDLKNLIT